MTAVSPSENRVADVHYAACRECGRPFEAIDDSHLTGGDCTDAATTLNEYRRTHSDAPVAASAPRGHGP